MKQKISEDDFLQAKALISALRERWIICVGASGPMVVIKLLGIELPNWMLWIEVALMIVGAVYSVSCIVSQLRAIRHMNKLGQSLNLWYLWILLALPFLFFGIVVETGIFLSRARNYLADLATVEG